MPKIKWDEELIILGRILCTFFRVDSQLRDAPSTIFCTKSAEIQHKNVAHLVSNEYIYVTHKQRCEKCVCFFHVKAKVLERKWKERVRKEMHGMFGWVCECLLISLLTFDEMSVSVGDDSCNKNEMNTVNAWLAAFEKQVNDLIFSGGYYEISE